MKNIFIILISISSVFAQIGNTDIATKSGANTFTGPQTYSNNVVMNSGAFTAGGMTETTPNKTGNVLPATCTPGNTFIKLNDPATQQLKVCTATNTWTTLGGSSYQITSHIGAINSSGSTQYAPLIGTKTGTWTSLEASTLMRGAGTISQCALLTSSANSSGGNYVVTLGGTGISITVPIGGAGNNVYTSVASTSFVNNSLFYWGIPGVTGAPGIASISCVVTQ